MPTVYAFPTMIIVCWYKIFAFNIFEKLKETETFTVVGSGGRNSAQVLLGASRYPVPRSAVVGRQGQEAVKHQTYST